MSKPKYEHDCQKCVFLGSFDSEQNSPGKIKTFDLYVCPIGNSKVMSTVIGRYDSEGSHYMSGLIFARRNISEVLVEAYNKALSLGFIDDKIQS